jgi:SAM-dependent methyltransferase
MKSNLEHWKALQATNYFDNHPCYAKVEGRFVVEGEDAVIIQRYTPLNPEKRVAVIGCGFGRETVFIAPLVRHVWGVDVSEHILDKAQAFLAAQGVANFTPVLAERWKTDVPDGLDLVFCCIVFQHITRDLVWDYLSGMAGKLAPGGEWVCQFAELSYGTQDAEQRVYEPCVRWTAPEIRETAARAGYSVLALDTRKIPGHGLWHWAHLRLADQAPGGTAQQEDRRGHAQGR